MNNLIIKILTACSLFVVLSCQSIIASNLSLTTNELSKIKSACSECFENELMICGNENIGFGKKFIGNFFQGVPSKGFFITPPYLSSNFKDLLRTEQNYNKLKLIVHDQFIKLQLIVVSKNFDEVYSLSNPTVDVIIPEPLHNCLKNKLNKWGCGVSENRANECCEKKLGSPVIKVEWIDTKNKEVVELLYNPNMGSTKLVRIINGKSKLIYYCQTLESVKI